MEKQNKRRVGRPKGHRKDFQAFLNQRRRQVFDNAIFDTLAEKWRRITWENGESAEFKSGFSLGVNVAIEWVKNNAFTEYLKRQPDAQSEIRRYKILKGLKAANRDSPRNRFELLPLKTISEIIAEREGEVPSEIAEAAMRRKDERGYGRIGLRPPSVKKNDFVWLCRVIDFLDVLNGRPPAQDEVIDYKPRTRRDRDEAPDPPALRCKRYESMPVKVTTLLRKALERQLIQDIAGRSGAKAYILLEQGLRLIGRN